MKNNFNNIAGFYDLLARLIFGKEIVRSQLIFLPGIKKGGKVLIAGGGTGWILKEVIKFVKPESVVYAESSEAMIKQAQRKITNWSPKFMNIITFHHGDENEVEGEFDLIVTPFYLDIYKEENIGSRIQSLYSRLKPDGIWYFVDFRYPEKGAMRFVGSALIKTMYLFFGWTAKLEAKELPNFESHFAQLAMLKIKQKYFFGRMIEAILFRKK